MKSLRDEVITLIDAAEQRGGNVNAAKKSVGYFVRV
jgi:hypothetical protein